MIWKTLFIVLSFATSGLFLERRKCCGGENIITMNNTCIDGSKLITRLQCPKKYVLDPEDATTYNFTLDGNHLVIELEQFVKLYVPPEKYCLGRLNETLDESEEAAIICEEWSMTGTYVKAVCSGIALFLLVVIILIYLAVPTLQDLLGACIIVTLTCLVIAYTIAAVLLLHMDFPNEYCVYTVSALYLFLLFAYFWLNVLSFHVLRKVLMFQGSAGRWFLIYCIYGFGTPVLLLLSAILTHSPGIDEEILDDLHMTCWLGSKSTMMFIYGPVLIIVILTSAVILVAVKKLWNDVDPDHITRRTMALRCKCLLVFYMFLVMAITWILETLAFFSAEVHTYTKDILHYTDLIHAVLLFLVLVILRKRTIRGLGLFGFFCISCPTKCRSVIDEEDGNQTIAQENKSFL